MKPWRPEGWRGFKKEEGVFVSKERAYEAGADALAEAVASEIQKRAREHNLIMGFGLIAFIKELRGEVTE